MNVHGWQRASVQYRWPVANKKHALLSSASAVLLASDVVLTFLLAFEQLNSPNVWETWMIQTRKSLLVDIFLTRRLSKSLAFCEFVSIDFESWKLDYKQNVHATIYFKDKQQRYKDHLKCTRLVKITWTVLYFLVKPQIRVKANAC